MSALRTWSASATGKEIVRIFQDNVRDRIFLITGPSENGIGGATAIALASSPEPPAAIILAGRSEKKISAVTKKIHDKNPAISVISIPLDLSSQASIRSGAEMIMHHEKIDRIDVIINNAAIMGCSYTPIDWDGDGTTILDSQFVVNYLGVFLFTNLIMAKILRGAPGSRIVSISSSGHRFSGIRWDDVTFKGGDEYDPWDAYGQSKTAIILFTVALAARYTKNKITSLTLHPGAVQSELGRYMQPSDRVSVMERVMATPNFEPLNPKSVEQGCSTSLHAALDPELEASSGSYLHDYKPAEPAAHAKGLEQAEHLWKLTEGILGQEF